MFSLHYIGIFYFSATYFHNIVVALEQLGYQRNISIRGAPFDFRKAPSKNHILHVLSLARLLEVQKSYCSHPGLTHSRSILLKFSRSLYLDNQLSESIHTWTIGTL